MMALDHDVVVVGAGPAGSAVAMRLAATGHDVVVLERARFPRDKACAEYCTPGVEDVLRRLLAWDAVERQGPRRLDGMVVYSRSRVPLEVSYVEHGIRRQAFTMPRAVLDESLMRHARACGATVHEGWRVLDVSPDREHMTVRATGERGESETLHARVVVGADGLHSTVARALGLLAGVRWPRRLGLVTHYADVPDLDRWGEMHVGKDIYCGLAPLPGGKLNVGLVVPLRRGRGQPVSTLFGEATESLPGLAPWLRGGRQIKAIRGMGPMRRRVTAAAGKGFLLVGDAAGFVDPFTGEGIYRALRSGEMAAMVIERELDPRPRERGSPDRVPDLGAYASERGWEFGPKERLTWIIQLGLKYPPLLDHLCRRLGNRDQDRALIGNILGDCAPASDMLHPVRLAALIKPW